MLFELQYERIQLEGDQHPNYHVDPLTESLCWRKGIMQMIVMIMAILLVLMIIILMILMMIII